MGAPCGAEGGADSGVLALTCGRRCGADDARVLLQTINADASAPFRYSKSLPLSPAPPLALC
eukprot:2304720-Rhodomonas_salina.1